MHNILSIQSHVAYGYVGNKAAVFPMQRLGNEVWVINTVQFSNHTGYGKWQGDIFSADHIKNVFSGLKEMGLLEKCDAVVSGYIGNSLIGEAVLEIVKEVKNANPKAYYCCDPVMGDVGRGFFVKEGIFQFMLNQAVIVSDIITPNQFEACALAEMEIKTLEDAKIVAQKLCELGPKIILITSLIYENMPTNTVANLVYDGKEFYYYHTPFLNFDVMPNGCGDMVSALFLTHYLRTKNIQISLENTITSVYEVIKNTYDNKSRELLIVKSQASFI